MAALDAAAKGRVAVIGGGIAGLSTALHLAREGLGVEVFERFDLLGGKLKGWETLLPKKREVGPQPVEHGMHGWWTHYHNFRKVLKARAGAEPALVPVRRIWWVDASRLDGRGRGRWVVDEELLSGLFSLWNLWNLFQVWRWPLYFRIARTGLGIFGFGDALRLGITALALRLSFVGWVLVRLHRGFREAVAFLSHEPPESLDQKTIRQLMDSLPVGRRISQLFDVLTGMGTYGRPTEQSAYHVSRLLDFYVMRSPGALWFEMCADSAHADGVWPMIEEANQLGVTLSTHCPVTRLEPEDDGLRWRVHTEQGARSFNYVVLALDIGGAQRLLQASSVSELGGLVERVSKQRLNHVMAVRIWFRNRVSDLTAPPHALALSAAQEAGCPFDFVFLPSRFQRRPQEAGGEVIEFHISYAERFKELSLDQLVDMILPWALRLFPELQGPDPVVHTVLSEINNYTRVPKEHLDHAPGVAGAAAGLYLCGDWIRWDSPVMYMEKAWVTGMAAAAHICRQEGLEPPQILPLPDPAPYQVVAQRLIAGLD